MNVYSYCYNNPLIYIDTSGNVPVGLVIYVSAVLASPDLQMDLEYLSADIAAGDVVSSIFDAIGILVPGGTGFGTASKNIVKSFKKLFGISDDATRAAKKLFGDGKIALCYRTLKALVKGTGLEVHHLIEKRFAAILGLNADDILSIAVDQGTHSTLTQLFRKAIAYSSSFDFLTPGLITTKNATPQDIWDAIVKVYTEAGMTEYLEAIKQQIIQSSSVADQIIFE